MKLTVRKNKNQSLKNKRNHKYKKSLRKAKKKIYTRVNKKKSKKQKKKRFNKTFKNKSLKRHGGHPIAKNKQNIVRLQFQNSGKYIYLFVNNDTGNIYQLIFQKGNNDVVKKLEIRFYCIPELSEIKSQPADLGENEMIVQEARLKGNNIINFFKLINADYKKEVPQIFKHGKGINWNQLLKGLLTIKEDNPNANTFIIGSHHALLRDHIFDFGDIDEAMYSNNKTDYTYKKRKKGLNNCCCIHVKFTKKNNSSGFDSTKHSFEPSTDDKNMCSNCQLDFTKHTIQRMEGFRDCSFPNGHDNTFCSACNQSVRLHCFNPENEIIECEVKMLYSKEIHFEDFDLSNLVLDETNLIEKLFGNLYNIRDIESYFNKQLPETKKKIYEFCMFTDLDTVKLTDIIFDNVFEMYLIKEVCIDSIYFWKKCNEFILKYEHASTPTNFSKFINENFSEFINELDQINNIYIKQSTVEKPTQMNLKSMQRSNIEDLLKKLNEDQSTRIPSNVTEMISRLKVCQEEIFELMENDNFSRLITDLRGKRKELNIEKHKYEEDHPDPFSSEPQKHRKPLEITVSVAVPALEEEKTKLEEKLANIFNIKKKYVISFDSHRPTLERQNAATNLFKHKMHNLHFKIYTSLEKEKQIIFTLSNVVMNKELITQLSSESFKVTVLTSKSFYFTQQYFSQNKKVDKQNKKVDRYQNVCTDDQYTSSVLKLTTPGNILNQEVLSSLIENNTLSLFFIRHGNAYHNPPCKINKTPVNQSFVQSVSPFVQSASRRISTFKLATSDKSVMSITESDKKHLDTPLTCLGISQAIRLGIHLSNQMDLFPNRLQDFKEEVVVVSGALQRAQHTALTVYNEILNEKSNSNHYSLSSGFVVEPAPEIKELKLKLNKKPNRNILENIIADYQQKSHDRLKHITDKNKEDLFKETEPFYKHLYKEQKSRFEEVKSFVDKQRTPLATS